MEKKKIKNIVIVVVIIGLIAWVGVMAVGVIAYLNKRTNNQANTVVFDDFNNEENNNNEESIIDKYSKYLSENILNEETKIEGMMIDCDEDGILELIIRHDNNKKLKVLYISGDIIHESEDFGTSSVTILYEVKNETPDFYIETTNNYISINEIIKDKIEIAQIDKNNEFKYLYVPVDIKISMYSISSDSIYSDLEKIKEKSEEQLITSDLEVNVKQEIKEIKENILVKDENGISNSNYSIKFGDYICNTVTLRLNSDSSVVYYDSFNNHNVTTYSGSYYIENDVIYVNISHVSSIKAFKIIEDNRIQEINRKDIYNLK